MKIEIIIPTKDRALSLDKALRSLVKQTRLPDLVTVVDGGSVDETHKIVESYAKSLNIRLLISEPGLIKQMNYAVERAIGDIVVRTDDDVIFSEFWVSEIYTTMCDPSILGVTGPTVVPKEFRSNRDLFRMMFNTGLIATLKRSFYNYFCDGKMWAVGHWSSCGVFSVGSNIDSCISNDVHEVQYLEACNYSVRLSILKEVGGFDPIYSGIGEYHEPDACFRMKYAYPDKKFIFNPKVFLNHCPSLKGFFNERSLIYPRVENYINFINKHKSKGLVNFSKFKFVLYLSTIAIFFSFRIRTKAQLKDFFRTLSLIGSTLYEK